VCIISCAFARAQKSSLAYFSYTNVIL